MVAGGEALRASGYSCLGQQVHAAVSGLRALWVRMDGSIGRRCVRMGRCLGAMAKKVTRVSWTGTSCQVDLDVEVRVHAPSMLLTSY